MVTAEAIAYGFDKLEVFQAVQDSSPSDVQVEGFGLLLTALGVEDVDALYDTITELYGPRYLKQTDNDPDSVAFALGAVLMGIAIGLSIREHERGHA